MNPEILLCDEPFSALDELTGQRLREEYTQLVRENGKTSIFVTHSINEALQLGERILVFHRPARITVRAVGPGRDEIGRVPPRRVGARHFGRRADGAVGKLSN